LLNDINLIPDKILYRKTRVLKKIAKFFLFTVLALALVGALSFRPYQWMKLKIQVLDINNKVNNSALKELSDAEVKLAQKQSESKDLSDMLLSVPVETIKATELIKRVTKLMPQSITAVGINYQGQIGEVKLDLTAKNRSDIPLFLKSLHDDPLYSDINISAISGKESPFRFTVTLGLGKEQKKTDK
jgi:hypothetical protein